MIYYYSGSTTRADAEVVLGDGVNLMLTYFIESQTIKPTPRFRRICKKRRQAQRRNDRKQKQ